MTRTLNPDTKQKGVSSVYASFKPVDIYKKRQHSYLLSLTKVSPKYTRSVFANVLKNERVGKKKKINKTRFRIAMTLGGFDAIVGL